MSQNDPSLAEKTREAFHALTPDQRGFIYRRVASREHKHHYFGRLFDDLHIAGFSRPHLANSWVGKHPQQRIDSFLLTDNGETRFKSLLCKFFAETHTQINDRFFELMDADKEGYCRAAGERSLRKMKEEVAKDIYWPLYEAAMWWFVLPRYPEKAEDQTSEPIKRGLEHEDVVVSEQKETSTTPIALSASADEHSHLIQSDKTIPQRDKVSKFDVPRDENLAVCAVPPGQEARSTDNIPTGNAEQFDQILEKIEAIPKQAPDLRVFELNTITKRLEAVLASLPDLEARLLELNDRLKKKIPLLQKVDWLKGFAAFEPIEIQKKAVIKSELKRLQDFDGKLGQLIQLAEQLTTLESRVEEPLPLWQPPVGSDLKEIVEECEKRIFEITHRIEVATERNRTFVSFVDAFAATNEETGPNFLAGLEPSELRDIGLEILRHPAKPDSSEAVRNLRGRLDIGGVILAHVWSLDATEGLNLAKLGSTASIGANRSGAADFLSFMNYGQLRELASQNPQVGPFIAELFFAGAVCHGRMELLEYLDPLLDVTDVHPLCAAFYRASIVECHRGHLGTPRSWLERDSEAQITAERARNAERCRQDLLDFIQRQPGMSKTYHRMRVYARSKFLAPLEQLIATRDAPEAIRLWRQHGTVESMVKDCAKAFSGSTQLDQSHLQQIERYIVQFQEKLLGWNNLVGQTGAPVRISRPIRDAIANLRREIDRGVQSDFRCQSLLRLIEAMAGNENGETIVPRDFGERCDAAMRVRVDPGAKDSLVDPFMMRSWPTAVAEESVALSDLLHDFLRSAIRSCDITPGELVHSYIQQRQVEAAKRMGMLREEWAKAFAHETAQMAAAFRLKNTDLLTEARQAREADRDISECLIEIENALENSRFSEADDWAGYLMGLLGTYRKRRDPVSTSLREFLAEVGETASQDVGPDELREMARIVRIENSTRREHVEEMLEAAQQSNLPAGLRRRWGEVAAQLDKPNFWQQPDCAAKLAGAIRVFRKYLSGKLKWRDKDPSTTDAIVDSLGEWVPTQLTQIVEKTSGRTEDVMNHFLGLASDVEDDCPSAHVLQVVGATKEPTTSPELAPVVVGGDVVVIREEKKTELTAGGTGAQLMAELRTEIRKHLPKVLSGTGGDARVLKAALARRDWSAATMVAADWLHEHANKLAPERFNDTEAVSLLSIAASAFSSPPSPNRERLWLLGCLGLGVADIGYYITPEVQEELASKLFAHLVGQKDIEGAAARIIKTSLEQLDDLPPTEVKTRPVGELFRIASLLEDSNSISAAARFARIVWNGLRMEDNYRPRAGLLHLLYKLGQLKVIETLADTARPHHQLVINCVRAFAHAESNPDARAHGQQLRKALEALGGLRPWRLFIASIDMGPAVQDEAPLECELESEFVTQQPNGRRLIELRLKPSLANPPKLLEMRLGGENSKFSKIVIQDEPLYGERTIALVVPPDFHPLEGGTARIPYEMTGETIFGESVRIRAAWEVKFDDKPAVPISTDQIIRAWPGASGNPVTRAKGFHGREKELDAIFAYVEATPRPRSVMLFGQRRIGKTSLAKEAVTNFDLDRDGVAAAFFDVAGLTLSKDGSGIASAFFNYLVSQLRSPDNAHLKTWLGTGAYERLEHRLQGLNPESSLLDCFDSMAQVFGELSRGRVQRFALVIDEFDRFVEPMLSGHRESVQRFFWNLRSVVQRAERVSLILAGSGLQKLLVQGYEDALFGSIDEIHVEPFAWKEDASAVLDTVFPADIRARLCRAQDTEELAGQACELCGGHPMYLTLLGSAAAMLCKGRRLSADTLNRVVDRLVREGINEPGLQIDRKRFYNPTFQTLARLPVKTQALAKLILVHIAERTTPEYTWELVANVTAAEVLPSNVKRSDGLEALKRLEEERVVSRDRNGSRVRITVPLTAAALRQDIVPLREEALQSFELQDNP